MNPKEFREVVDRVFTMMSTDPEMGPKLRDAETPQRFEFPDIDLVVNITAAADVVDGQNLVWEWSDDVDWEPEVKMAMDSDVANRYFQGKGNVKKALALIPITKPVYAKYREMLEQEYPHLLA